MAYKFKLCITGDLGFEFWRDIPGYEGLYQASTYGNIRSVDRYIHLGNGKGTDRFFKGEVISQFLKNNGKYWRITLSNKSKLIKYQVHYLIALTFPEKCGKWFEGATVDHLNGNGLDNRFENLMFKTQKDNYNNPNTYFKCIEKSKENLKKALTKEAIDKSRHSKSKPVKCVETGKEYWSRLVAAEETQCNPCSIWRCCKGLQKTANKLHWAFA